VPQPVPLLGDHPGSDPNPIAIEARIHARVNRIRHARGLPALSLDPDLREVARSHSRDMADREYTGHVSPEGESFHDRYERFGYRCRRRDGRRVLGGAENVARLPFRVPARDRDGGPTETYTTVDELATGVVTGWMESPGHRENLLREPWLAEGIGVAVVQRGRVTRTYVTQNFC
jgi:uncharacterized protein YkwD